MLLNASVGSGSTKGILQVGFVHVMLRQIPHGDDDDSPNKIKIELSVLDSGKVCQTKSLL
jgi:hypothetical protein